MRREDYLPASVVGCTKIPRQWSCKTIILSVVRDPREGEAADGKEKDFLVVLKSLTPKEISRP